MTWLGVGLGLRLGLGLGLGSGLGVGLGLGSVEREAGDDLGPRVADQARAGLVQHRARTRLRTTSGGGISCPPPPCARPVSTITVRRAREKSEKTFVRLPSDSACSCAATTSSGGVSAVGKRGDAVAAVDFLLTAHRYDGAARAHG